MIIGKLILLLILVTAGVAFSEEDDIPQDLSPSVKGNEFKSPQKNETKAPSSQSQQAAKAPAAPKPAMPQKPINAFAASATQTNALKNQMQSGVNNNQATAAQYQASVAQTTALKEDLDKMARSGKYDTKNYDEALAVLSIPANSFNYQPPQASETQDSNPAPSPTSRPAPVAETTKIPGFTSPAATTETPALPVPSSELADTRVPADYAGRAPAAAGAPSPSNSSNTSNSPASSFPSFAPPALIAPPTDSALTPQGNSLQQLESAPSDSASGTAKGNSGSLTQSAPARGLSSVASEEPSEAEIAAAVSRKIADDHKRKVADAKAGKNGDKTKPTLADRLKGSGVISTPDEHTPSPVPVAPSAVSTPTLKDELFWFGPQKFGRILLDAAGLEKKLGLDKPRNNSADKASREISSLPAVAAPTAVEWLQVLLGWMTGAIVLLGSIAAFTRRKIQALRRPPAPVVEKENKYIEPSSETEFREISSHTETAVLEIDTDSKEGGTGVYVIEKSPSGKVISRSKLAANSVVAANMLRTKDQKNLAIKDGTERIKYAGNGKFEKTSEPVCILVHVKPKK